ncbi:50S ribosomal protein L25 [Posidoniimonas polymericola]|uniref:Large ribosomal subunit protein bL25 n=1 Tax=Posidoniimonas polymericola TaxID=2528002 RepID=A0A5C5YIH5_9BACT|nr:50S ribosomal protein L25 [Posidoniimonas polymericola]TWT74661.1 50S ribosomal protein L25 [Posidoniimonas polymericola]
MSDILKAEPRDKVGKLHNRRLRATGKIPAVLYGHGEGSVSLTLAKEQLRTVLRHGGKLVELQGAASGQALLQDLQWDAFGKRLLHVDLLRVQAGDRVTVEIPVELKGEAPGENEGGVLEFIHHTVSIEVSPSQIPEKLHIDASGLHLGESLHADKIIDLPKDAKVLLDEQEVIVHCVPPAGEPADDEEGAVGGGSEPEVIGKKEEDEESDS